MWQNPRKSCKIMMVFDQQKIQLICFDQNLLRESRIVVEHSVVARPQFVIIRLSAQSLEFHKDTRGMSVESHKNRIHGLQVI